MIVFCNGLYFALRSSREHRQLRLRPCQIEVIEHENERPYLKYTEDVSKNRPGGLKGKNVKPKIVYHKVPRIDEHLAVAEVQDQLQVYDENRKISLLPLRLLQHAT